MPALKRGRPQHRYIPLSPDESMRAGAELARAAVRCAVEHAGCLAAFAENHILARNGDRECPILGNPLSGGAESPEVDEVLVEKRAAAWRPHRAIRLDDVGSR